MAFSIDKVDASHKLPAAIAPRSSQLVTRLRPHIEKQLLRYPLSDEDRHDLVQSTLMQIIRRVGSFRGDSSFSTWLFRVTANEALMLMRSQRRHRARLVEGLDLEDLGSLPAANDGPRVRPGRRGRRSRASATRAFAPRSTSSPPSTATSSRSTTTRTSGLQEIADRLGATESAVRSRLHRARSRLRAILSREAGSVVAA